MPVNFRMRWIPLLATVIVVAIGVSLGQWQTHRGDAKEAMQESMNARAGAAPIERSEMLAAAAIDQLQYRRVRLTGQFVPQWTVYLDNRSYKGVSGFYVLTPFKVANSQTVLMVERGWGPRDMQDRTSLPVFTTPDAPIVIEGIVRRDAGHLLQLGEPQLPQPGAIMQNLDIASFAQASRLQMLPLLIEQSNDLKDGLVRDWPLPSLGIERHRGYAMQWYALALMALIFFVVTGLRSGKK